jgi:acyl-coenzyme A thioesterase PaaI-like protein
MGMRIEHREATHAITTIELKDDIRGAAPGTLHGGAMATVADVTSALALWGTYQAGVEVPVTTDMHIRYYGRRRTTARLRIDGDHQPH